MMTNTNCSTPNTAAGAMAIDSPRQLPIAPAADNSDETPPTIREAVDYAVWVVGNARRRRLAREQQKAAGGDACATRTD